MGLGGGGREATQVSVGQENVQDQTGRGNRAGTLQKLVKTAGRAQKDSLTRPHYPENQKGPILAERKVTRTPHTVEHTKKKKETIELWEVGRPTEKHHVGTTIRTGMAGRRKKKIALKQVYFLENVSLRKAGGEAVHLNPREKRLVKTEKMEEAKRRGGGYIEKKKAEGPPVAPQQKKKWGTVRTPGGKRG